MRQSPRELCFKFQSCSPCRTSKGSTWSNWYTLIYVQFLYKSGGFMNPGKSDSAFGVILWGRMVHQSLRPVCFKFESSSSYRTSAGPMWSIWYTVIFLETCIKQWFPKPPWKDISEFGVMA